jgi:hypothetical protein
MKKVKGQFFVLGAIIIVTLFFIGLPKSYPLTYERSADIVYIFDNIEREYPIALNLGLNESNQIDTMKNFTWFADRVASEHLINFTVLWVITETSNTSSEDLNVTIGNFLGHSTTVHVETWYYCGGPADCYWDDYVTVGDNSTNHTLNMSFGHVFNMTVSFDSEQKDVYYLRRDKTNFYVFISLERDENVIRDHITG